MKRYEHCKVLNRMISAPDGEWVKYEDVEGLEGKLKQAEIDRDHWKRWCNSAEQEASYLRCRLDNIRQEADIRQPTEEEWE